MWLANIPMFTVRCKKTPDNNNEHQHMPSPIPAEARPACTPMRWAPAARARQRERAANAKKNEIQSLAAGDRDNIINYRRDFFVFLQTHKTV